MAICSGIDSGATYSCDNPIQPGVNARIWLANYDDIASYTFGTNNNVVTAITMNATTYFYPYQGFKQSVEPSTELVAGPVSVQYNHSLTFHVFDISSTMKVNLQKMALNKIVAIIENVNAAGNSDSVFEIFGGGVGLEMISLTRLSRDAETMGSFAIQLQTSDNEGKESKLPYSLWNTDYATTLAAIEALEVP